MIIITNEKRITLTWVQEYLALVDLSRYDQKEMVKVHHTAGQHLLWVSFGALQQLRANASVARRVTNNYEQRRALVAQQLASGGNPS